MTRVANRAILPSVVGSRARTMVPVPSTSYSLKTAARNSLSSLLRVCHPPVAVAHPPARLFLLDDHHGATIPTRSDAKRRTDRREDRADSIRSRCRAKRALGRSERDRPDGRAVACAARAGEAKISSRSARKQEKFSS